jgi:hypothetical protein
MGDVYTNHGPADSRLSSMSKQQALGILASIGLFAVVLSKTKMNKIFVGAGLGAFLGVVTQAASIFGYSDQLPISGALPGIFMGTMLGSIAHFGDNYVDKYIDSLETEAPAEEEQTTPTENKSKATNNKKGKKTAKRS